MNPDVLNLPWETLVTISCGYMGYFVSNVGVRNHHKAIDVAFSTLVFGFVAAFAYQISQKAEENILISAVYAAVVACTVGAMWRVYGRRLLRRILRKADISYSDDVPTAWVSLFNEQLGKATELSVKTKSGTIYLSSDLNRFRNLPNGPCEFGREGDILMYVTDVKEIDGEFVEQDDLQYPEWGAVVTYIPAAEISRVRFRRV